MDWDLMTIKDKKEWYQSYLEDILYEWGTCKGAMTFEEFDARCSECGGYCPI